MKEFELGNEGLQAVKQGPCFFADLGIMHELLCQLSAFSHSEPQVIEEVGALQDVVAVDQ